jgi:hypothetical protein
MHWAKSWAVRLLVTLTVRQGWCLAGRQLLLERLAAGTFLGQRLLIPAVRQLLLERLAAGTFLGQRPVLGQQFLLVLAGRQLLFERLAASTFLRQVGFGPIGHLRRGSSLSLSHFACRLSRGLFLGRLPSLFPARRSHGCTLLLGSFPLVR